MRLRGRADIKLVFRQGEHYHLGAMQARVLRRSDDLRRYMITVSKRLGGAVVRNRVRRWVREALREALRETPREALHRGGGQAASGLEGYNGWDVCLFFPPSSRKQAAQSYKGLCAEVDILMKRLWDVKESVGR